MTDYNIIRDLTKGKFYSGGKIFIKLNPEDPAKREEIFEKVKQSKNQNHVSKINFYKTQENENNFKSKLMNEFLDLSRNQNPASIENIEADASKFIDKLLPDDLIIFVPSTGINSNELHDLKSKCIIYLELNKNLNLGFVIDKTFEFSKIAFNSFIKLSGSNFFILKII